MSYFGETRRFNASNDYGYGHSTRSTRPAPLAPGRTFTPSTTRPASPAALSFLDSLTAQRYPQAVTAPLQSLLTLRAAHPAEFTAASASFSSDACASW